MSLVLVLSPTLTNQGPIKTTKSGPSVTPTLAQSRLPSLDPVLPQCWSNPDYCYLMSVIGVKPRQLHQMADSTNPSLGGHVIQWYYLWGYSKNYWGFQGYSPFHYTRCAGNSYTVPMTIPIDTVCGSISIK